MGSQDGEERKMPAVLARRLTRKRLGQSGAWRPRTKGLTPWGRPCSEGYLAAAALEELAGAAAPSIPSVRYRKPHLSATSSICFEVGLPAP